MYAKFGWKSLGFLFLFFSCSNLYQDQIEPIQITSPRTDWTYFEGRVIQLSMNIRSSSIEWYSDKEGYLGSGNGIFVTLWSGLHAIEAHYNGVIYSVTVDIKYDTTQYLEERRQLITPEEVKVNLPNGKWYPAIVTLEGMAGFLSYSNPQPRSGASLDLSGSREPNRLRDLHIKTENIQELKIIKSRQRLLRSAVGDKKLFNVLNTVNQYDAPHEVLGEMIYSGSRYTLWRDTWTPIDPSALSSCINSLNNIIIPRLTTIWGEWADVDGDGKIAILFSPTISTEGQAIGFFNPQDFFLSEDVNPHSNQMDILYVGYPDASPSSSYNAAAISATIAHEFTHAITFSQKTYNKIAMGNNTAARETVYLDEGWSHLSENLCGFGLSGGNILFLKKYFDDTVAYSFCSPNAFGQSDSTGMRGAMCLFMSWLFWRQGGMSWSMSNPGVVIDGGGITFLQNLIKSDQIGWNSIGSSLGVTMDELFLEFLYEMNRQRVLGTVYPYKVDPHTGEPVEFFNNMGALLYQGTTYNISISPALPPDETVNTPPWSFFFIDALPITEDSILKINLQISLGRVMYSMIKGTL
jgi:hypothetical protein